MVGASRYRDGSLVLVENAPRTQCDGVIDRKTARRPFHNRHEVGWKKTDGIRPADDRSEVVPGEVPDLLHVHAT